MMAVSARALSKSSRALPEQCDQLNLAAVCAKLHLTQVLFLEPHHLQHNHVLLTALIVAFCFSVDLVASNDAASAELQKDMRLNCDIVSRYCS